jgi:hypothetical protein
MASNCGRCDTRGGPCQECVVTVVASPGAAPHLGAEELRALSVLADAGMLPPLRLRTEPTALPMRRSWEFPASKAS